jgi:hypothetical protein
MVCSCRLSWKGNITINIKLKVVYNFTLNNLNDDLLKKGYFFFYSFQPKWNKI